MAPDTMHLRLHLRLIRVLTVLVDTASRLEVEVISTRSWSRCPHCGFKTRTVHDSRRRKIRDLPVSGRRTTLVWIRHRFACGNCDERQLLEPTLDAVAAAGLLEDIDTICFDRSYDYPKIRFALGSAESLDL